MQLLDFKQLLAWPVKAQSGPSCTLKLLVDHEPLMSLDCCYFHLLTRPPVRTTLTCRASIFHLPSILMCLPAHATRTLLRLFQGCLFPEAGRGACSRAAVNSDRSLPTAIRRGRCSWPLRSRSHRQWRLHRTYCRQREIQPLCRCWSGRTAAVLLWGPVHNVAGCGMEVRARGRRQPPLQVSGGCRRRACLLACCARGRELAGVGGGVRQSCPGPTG